MSNILGILGVLAFFAVLGGTTPLNNAYGLSCAPANTTESLKYADVVFYGKAVSKEYVPSEHDKKRQDAIVQFSVIESFKGITEHQVSIISEEWLWGFNFTEGVEYVVFAGKNGNDALRYQECSPTGTLEYVDIDELRDISQKYIIPPLQQLAAGIPLEKIQCKEEFARVIKLSNNIPICVKSGTVPKLVKRGVITNQFDTTNNPGLVIPRGDLLQQYSNNTGGPVYQKEITILSTSPQNVTLPEPKKQTPKTTCSENGVCFTPE